VGRNHFEGQGADGRMMYRNTFKEVRLEEMGTLLSCARCFMEMKIARKSYFKAKKRNA
jgi:hypothetical protein